MKEKLMGAVTKVADKLSNLKKSEVAEALIATWCIEFLRVRKIGGFNVVEIVVISALMLGVKTIVVEAGKRKYHGSKREVVMSTEVMRRKKEVDIGKGAA